MKAERTVWAMPALSHAPLAKASPVVAPGPSCPTGDGENVISSGAQARTAGLARIGGRARCVLFRARSRASLIYVLLHTTALRWVGGACM